MSNSNDSSRLDRIEALIEQGFAEIRQGFAEMRQGFAEVRHLTESNARSIQAFSEDRSQLYSQLRETTRQQAENFQRSFQMQERFLNLVEVLHSRQQTLIDITRGLHSRQQTLVDITRSLEERATDRERREQMLVNQQQMLINQQQILVEQQQVFAQILQRLVDRS